MDKIINIRKLNVIAGDFNINMNATNSDTNSIQMLCDKFGLEQIVDFNTRICKKTATKIDLILTNMKEKLKCEPVHTEKISDHETIRMIIECDEPNSHNGEMVLSWKNYSKENLVNNLRNCDWANFYTNDIDSKLKLLRDNITQSVAPLTKYVMINNESKPNKWYDDELANLKQKTWQARMKWLNCRVDALWQNYVTARNEYNTLIKLKKNNHTKNEIRCASNDQKKMWHCLNKLISNKKRARVGDEIVFPNCTVSNTNEICENFNNYFIESIIKINEMIPVSNERSEMTHTEASTQFKFKMVNVEKIGEILNFLKKKINRSELCNSNVWFDAFEYCGYFQMNIINASLSTGVLPKAWKISTVTPIQKIKNTARANEFRPINTLPNDAKVIEKIVKEQLTEYIEKNNILSPNQSAYRKNHSCESTINCAINDWKDSHDKGQNIVIAFLDLKRAFETVNRNAMLKQLESIGIKDVELKWFKDYLSERKQNTKLNGMSSKDKEIPIGLPQGTALSVILFILYIDGITKVVKNSTVTLFADDAMIVTKDKNVNIAIIKLNEDLNRIYNWLNEKRLMLNIDKTKWMLIARGKPKCKLIDVKIANNNIERVSQMKYLGIILDDKLCFEQQVKNCMKKTASKVNFLSRISKKLPFDTEKIIYNTIVQPHSRG